MKLHHRLAIISVLLLFAAFFLLPLYVMVSTSLKDMSEIRSGNLLSLPQGLNFDAWRMAWSQACTGADCTGLKPYFANSVLMVVPAVLISTALGAINGYVFSKWRFRGSELMFALMLFGAFMPLQVVLLPMSQVLGWFSLADSIWGLVIVHVLVGLSTTTLFFRNYYVSLPDELMRAAMLDGADLARADLSGADLSDASLVGADLQRALVGPVVIKGRDGRPTGQTRTTNLSRANLQAANLADVNLPSATTDGVKTGKVPAGTAVTL